MGCTEKAKSLIQVWLFDILGCSVEHSSLSLVCLPPVEFINSCDIGKKKYYSFSSFFLKWTDMDSSNGTLYGIQHSLQMNIYDWWIIINDISKPEILIINFENDLTGTCIVELDRQYINCAGMPNGENRLFNNKSKWKNLWKKLPVVIWFEANLLKSVHLYNMPKAFFWV